MTDFDTIKWGLVLSSLLLAACAGQEVAQVPNQQGANLYQHHCIGCHQQHARGDSFKVVPSLAGQNPIYLQRQLEHFRLEDRKSAQMHWALQRTALNHPSDVTALTEYLASLPPNRKPQSGSTRDAAVGAAIYQERCARCHGPEALGMPDGAIPSIRHQHDSYLRARLRSLARHEDATIDSAMTRAITPLSDKQIVAVAAYLSAW